MQWPDQEYSRKYMYCQRAFWSMVASSGATARIDLISDPNSRSSIRQRVVQRLDAQSVARQQQTPAARVIDRESKHAAQLLNTIASHLLVEMDDHFCVAVSVENVTAAFEIRTKLGEVVNFSVVDDTDGFVFVENRLVTSGEVDDAQPPHAQARAVLYENAFVIGSAMNNALTHPMDGS